MDGIVFICSEILKRFPSSAAAQGGKELRLNIRKVFPDVGEKNPDDLESFLEAAELLEKQNIVSLIWEKFKQGEKLKTIIVTHPEQVYKLLNEVFPIEGCKETGTNAKEKAEILRQKNNPSADFFTWLEKTLTNEDFSKGINADIIENLYELFVHLPSHISNNELTCTPRSLSIKIFNDSKKIEGLLNKTSFLFKRAEKEGVIIDGLSLLDRNFPEVLITGSLRITGAGSFSITCTPASTISLAYTAVKKTQNIELHTDTSSQKQRKRVLCIENKETFYALSAAFVSTFFKSFDVLLYTGGYANKAVLSVLKTFYQSGFSLYHAGDLDPDGILIFQNLYEELDGKITPVFMNTHIFRFYEQYGRKLNQQIISRTKLIKPSIRTISDMQKLIELIEQTGIGIEQEIIDYNNFTGDVSNNRTTEYTEMKDTGIRR